MAFPDSAVLEVKLSNACAFGVHLKFKVKEMVSSVPRGLL